MFPLQESDSTETVPLFSTQTFSPEQLTLASSTTRARRRSVDAVAVDAKSQAQPKKRMEAVKKVMFVLFC